MGISFFWLCILFFLLFQLYPINETIDNKNDKNNNERKVSIYFFNFTQDTIDYSYQINISRIYNKLLQTNNVKFIIKVNGVVITNSSYYIVDYVSTKNILFKYKIKDNSSQFNPEPNYINLSMSITYFDNDIDNKLSVDDFFILKIQNMDDKQYYNFSNFRFEIVSIDDNIIGRLEFEKKESSIGQKEEEVYVEEGLN